MAVFELCSELETGSDLSLLLLVSSGVYYVWGLVLPYQVQHFRLPLQKTKEHRQGFSCRDLRALVQE